MKEKQEAYNLKKRTADLLPDVENNTAKLQVPGPNYHDVFFSLNRSPIHQTTIVCTAFSVVPTHNSYRVFIAVRKFSVRGKLH